MISVAAVDSTETVASFSQQNRAVEIAAPGVGDPHVSGAAGLIWSCHPNASNQKIRDTLNATARDKGAAGRDNAHGYGVVQARKAIESLGRLELLLHVRRLGVLTEQIGPKGPREHFRGLFHPEFDRTSA